MKTVYIVALKSNGCIGIEENRERLNKLDEDETYLGSINCCHDLINLLLANNYNEDYIYMIIDHYSDRLESFGYSDFPEDVK